MKKNVTCRYGVKYELEAHGSFGACFRLFDLMGPIVVVLFAIIANAKLLGMKRLITVTIYATSGLIILHVKRKTHLVDRSPTNMV